MGVFGKSISVLILFNWRSHFIPRQRETGIYQLMAENRNTHWAEMEVSRADHQHTEHISVRLRRLSSPAESPATSRVSALQLLRGPAGETSNTRLENTQLTHVPLF